MEKRHKKTGSDVQKNSPPHDVKSQESSLKSVLSDAVGSAVSRVSLPTRGLKRTESERKDHLRGLIFRRKARGGTKKKPMARISESMDSREMLDIELAASDGGMEKSEPENEALQQMSDRINAIYKEIEEYATVFNGPIEVEPLEVRMQNVTFTVMTNPNTKVETVYNTSFVYSLNKFYQRRFKRAAPVIKEKTPKKILNSINLVLSPGRMYLVLGAPGSGKSTLLRAIASRLHPKPEETLDGKIIYNGRELKDADGFYMQNAFGYISQLDKHAPRLTVEETFEFAHQCKTGGELPKEKDLLRSISPVTQEAIRQAKKTKLASRVMLAGLGLSEVKDTFVGDSDVRGVSGGQQRRVTVGEMYMSRSPVLCCDEISTGLDAASTFDMIEMILYFGRMRKLMRVISLLQPSPETVSLFDEVILLAEGQVLYSGPILEVQEYFAEIGFNAPEFMDCADFLQVISSGDGASLYEPPRDAGDARQNAPSILELADLYRRSRYAKRVEDTLATAPKYLWTSADVDLRQSAIVSGVAMSKSVMRRYANSFSRSTALILQRFLKIWIRDRRVIVAGTVKNVLMGVSVGGVFSNTDDPISVQGALFQATLFIMLGAMQTASGLVEDRIILCKHLDANFYSVWPFVAGRTLAQMPQTIMDILTFGTILYFTVGLGDGEDRMSNLVTYLATLLLFALLMSQQFSVFASFSTTSTLQALSSCTILLMMLFGGFIIAPNVVPTYFWWIYWWNPFAWMYRALLVLEFRSTSWDDPDILLTQLGFLTPDGEPFGREWVAYSFIYMGAYCLLCSMLTAVGLSLSCVEEGAAAEPIKTRKEPGSRSERVEIAFKPVSLSFHNVGYQVTASTKSEKLNLLENVSGIFRPGRMCALMGTSGAGKTTLMDVIALRKRSGNVTGDVLLNGWPQDPNAFRRCSGYVFQFDVQSPQLTVNETIVFSAKLRLDPEEVPGEHEDVLAFVENIMEDVELADLAPAIVGTEETGGLSFEQKKRLSIAVELAASPSILFLDEPTSGLDARSALLVVKTLRKIADSGRTICATIHQPSSTVFGMFNDLLLLKKGGKVVYHGELGESCSTLVSYFESRGAPMIELGENPAGWMLRVMSLESMGDVAETYVQSEQYSALKEELDEIKSSPNPKDKIVFASGYAVGSHARRNAVNARLRTIYWRSPTYNLTRLTVSGMIAFVLGSVFILEYKPYRLSEVEMRARLSTIFLSFIITGIMAIVSVLPVMTSIRDMYYRHRDAGMYGSIAMGLALGYAEQWFLVASSVIFTFIFLGTSHIGDDAGKYWFSAVFWGFFCFNLAIYSYIGQAFVCLVKPSKTAFILATVYLGFNNFFSGLIVRPQEMTDNFFAIPFAITPGRYVYEGLIISVFRRDNDAVVYADEESEYYHYLVDIGKCFDGHDCEGGTMDYVDFFFGGEFHEDNMYRNFGILGGILAIVRIGTWVALEYIRSA